MKRDKVEGEEGEGNDVSLIYAIFACFLQQISFPHEK